MGAWDSEWKVEYQDRSEAMPYLVKVIQTCYQLVTLKEYGKAYKLLDRVCRLEFRVDNDQNDYCETDYDDEGMDLKALVMEGLISINFNKISLNLLYTCYQSHAGQNRIDKLYEYLTWDMSSAVKITDIFACGTEKAEGTEIFMPEWCKYLTRISGDRAAELLVDACVFIGDDDYLLDMARKNAVFHPYLYKAYCERKSQSSDYTACVEIAKEAISQIDKNKVIRADISDIAVRAAKNLDDTIILKDFYQAAFYSKPNSWHLLRLFLLQDKATIKEALERVNEEPL